MTKDLVREYNKSFAEREWDRLTWPEGVIEFAVTTHALGQHLPPTGRILDIGGGAGRYSIWLAERGYQVTLADLSPDLLSIARQKIAEAGVESRIESIDICDASDLSRYPARSFDAVLCMGPFYHLTEQTERDHAAAEILRVLKPGGTAFIAVMPVYSFLRRTIGLSDERIHLTQPEFTTRLLDEGVFLNSVPERFNAGYGFRPQDVVPYFESCGLATITLLADTSFAAPLANPLAQMAETDRVAYDAAMKIIIETSDDPSVFGASVHLLYIGQKQP